MSRESGATFLSHFEELRLTRGSASLQQARVKAPATYNNTALFQKTEVKGFNFIEGCFVSSLSIWQVKRMRGMRGGVQKPYNVKIECPLSWSTLQYTKQRHHVPATRAAPIIILTIVTTSDNHIDWQPPPHQ